MEVRRISLHELENSREREIVMLGNTYENMARMFSWLTEN